MKKFKLFLAALAAMVGLSANAQLTDGTVYWIQDTGTGQFISQGGNWGTQATVQDVGGVGFEAVYVSDGVYKLKNIQWNKVNNADLGLRVTDGYCDQAASEVTLTVSGDGYKVGISGGNYLCNNQSENSYGVKPIGLSTNSADAAVWKFLTKSEYDAAIQVYKDSKAAGYATFLGYNGIATVAALETLINDADQFISKDYTSSITNAALNAGNTNGWTATKPNQRAQAFGSENGTMAESWNGCVVATQTVSNLPNGLYKVTFVGTFRPKASAEAERLTSEQTSSPAYVYANDSKEEFIHWIDVAAKANNRGAVKNNATAYTSSFYTYVTDGTLNLGVKQDTWYDGYMWCPFGYFTLTYYTDQVSDEDITALVATIPAEESIPAGVYSNLTSLKNTLESAKTIVAFNNLSNAITEANALVAPYAALLAEIAKAKALGIAEDTADGYANVTTAAEATTNTQNLMVDEYNYVATTYQYAVELGTWNASDNAGTMTSQHWDGTTTSSYLEQGGGDKAYNLSSWTVTYDQTLNLPAGNYVFKVAGRTATDHVTINLNVTNVSNSNEQLGTVNDFPKGDTGLGINKAGVTSFDPADPAGFANNGVGRGWQWRYVKFTLTEAATVKVAVVATADAQYRWMGFCNATVQTDDDANVSLIAYNVALNNAQTVLADATYTNVAGTDKSNLQAAIAADASLDKTDADAIDAATEALNTAVTTFTAGVASWNSLANARSAASSELPYASTSKKTALDNAVAAEVATAETAATQVGVIEQANRQYVESNALAEGVDGATNMTELISQANAPASFDEIVGWTVTDNVDGTNSTINNNEQFTQGDGTLGGAYYDGGDLWGKSAYTANYKQEIALEPGKYLLTVTSRASQDTKKFELYAGENKLEMVKIGAAIGTGVFDRGWNDQSLEFEIGSSQNVEIGVNIEQDKEHNWYSFTRFRLVQIEEAEAVEFASDEEMAAFNAAKAPSAKLGFDRDDYAPYNNIEQMAAAKDVIALVTEELTFYGGKALKSTVTDAIEALNAIEWSKNESEVNAVYDGTFATAINNGAPAGWRMSNNTLGGDYHSRAFVGDDRMIEFNETKSGLFLRFDGTNSSRGSMYYYGDTENYTMPLKAGVTYYAKVDVAGWGSTGKPIRMNVTGPEGFTAKYQQLTTSVRADNANNTPHQFFIVFTATVAGNYVINFQTPGAETNTHNVVISNVELKRVITIDEASSEAPTAMASANVTLTRTLSADYWNTFTSPVAISADEITTIFGEGTKVREMDGDKAVADNVIPFKDATEIVAGVPYLVKPAQTVANPTFTAKAVVNEAQTIENGDFKYIGILAKTHLDAPATDATALDLYLATDNTMKKPGSNGANLKGMRAYFNVPTEAAEVGVKIAFEDGGIVTSISSVDGAVDANEAVYNLAGQRVNKVQKGLYIVNGKKVLVK